MGAAFGEDLRKRVVSAVEAGGRYTEVSKIFSVSIASISRWCGRVSETGSVAAYQIGGHKTHVLTASHAEWIKARWAADASIPLRTLQRELAAQDTIVSYGALWNFVHAQGLSFKKNTSGN